MFPHLRTADSATDRFCNRISTANTDPHKQITFSFLRPEGAVREVTDFCDVGHNGGHTVLSERSVHPVR